MSKVGTDAITTKEAAGILGVTPRQVNRLREAGRLEPLMQLPGDKGAFLYERATITSFKSTPSSAMPLPDGRPPADEGVSSLGGVA